jgi:hypothetical protein
MDEIDHPAKKPRARCLAGHPAGGMGPDPAGRVLAAEADLVGRVDEGVKYRAATEFERRLGGFVDSGFPSDISRQVGCLSVAGSLQSNKYIQAF